MNANSTNNLMQNIKSSIAAKLLLIAALMQVVVFILWFVPTINLSIIQGTYYSYGGSAISDTTYSASTDSYAITKFFEGALIFNLIFIGLMLASLFFLVKPIIFNQLEKTNNLVLPKITSLVILGIYLIIFFSCKADVAKYADIGAVCRLNFGGWVFIILNVAILVLGIEISYKIKMNKITANSESNAETKTEES